MSIIDEQLNVFTCYIILLFNNILLLVGSLPLNVIVLNIGKQVHVRDFPELTNLLMFSV
jgi:hypothetical protein